MSLGHGASIVRNNLVLHLDAANPKSYPGSGTTWYDLSGNGYHGLLINGTTYSAGSMVFDGVDDYVSYANSSSLCAAFNGNVDFSILTVFNFVSGVYILDIGSVGDDPTGAMEFGVSGISRNNTGGGGSNIATTIIPSTWNFTAFTRSSSLLHSWYLNSVFINSAQTTEAYSVNDLVKTGRRAYSTSNIYKGSIASIMVYSKVLTAQEIRQNFEATRGRYGI